MVRGRLEAVILWASKVIDVLPIFDRPNKVQKLSFIWNTKTSKG
jgi:hypothetical protein